MRRAHEDVSSGQEDLEDDSSLFFEALNIPEGQGGSEKDRESANRNKMLV